MRAGAQLTDTKTFGAARGWSPKRALRTLKRLHDAHPGPWLFRVGRAWRINESLLRQTCPQMYEASSPADIEERIDALSEDVSELKFAVRALGARVRDLERRSS